MHFDLPVSMDERVKGDGVCFANLLLLFVAARGE